VQEIMKFELMRRKELLKDNDYVGDEKNMPKDYNIKLGL
jgi:hypothetical protein